MLLTRMLEDDFVRPLLRPPVSPNLIFDNVLYSSFVFSKMCHNVLSICIAIIYSSDTQQQQKKIRAISSV